MARVATGQIPGQQTQCHGREPRANKGDDLRDEQISIGSVGQYIEYDGLKQLGECFYLGEVQISASSKAVVDMIVDEGALGDGDGLFHGLELYRDFGTGPAVLDHANDMTQMTVSALQPLGDAGMGCMLMGFWHILIISPQGGYGK